MPLRPTIDHAGATRYARAGGPWDVPALDEELDRPTVRVVDGDRRLEGRALSDAIDAVVDWLRDMGAEPGEVISWQLPNGLETYLLYRACWRFGAIAAAVHRSAGPADVAAALARLLDDRELRARMGAAARRRAEATFSWDTLAAELGGALRRWEAAAVAHGRTP